MLSSKWWNNKASDTKLVCIYSTIIHLAQWRALVDMIVAGNFLANWEKVSFSRYNIFHKVTALSYINEGAILQEGHTILILDVLLQPSFTIYDSGVFPA